MQSLPRRPCNNRGPPFVPFYTDVVSSYSDVELDALFTVALRWYEGSCKEL